MNDFNFEKEINKLNKIKLIHSIFYDVLIAALFVSSVLMWFWTFTYDNSLFLISAILMTCVFVIYTINRKNERLVEK